METIKVLWNSLKPTSVMGQLKFAGAASISSILLVTYLNELIVGGQDDKLRYTVCWNPYKEFAKMLDHNDAYSNKEIRAAYYLYRDCIIQARQNNEHFVEIFKDKV